MKSCNLLSVDERLLRRFYLDPRTLTAHQTLLLQRIEKKAAKLQASPTPLIFDKLCKKQDRLLVRAAQSLAKLTRFLPERLYVEEDENHCYIGLKSSKG